MKPLAACQEGADARAVPGDLVEDRGRRLDARLVHHLDERDRELLARRYGADLSARQIAELLGERTNTVEVALHRALRWLRHELGPDEGAAAPVPPPLGSVQET